MKEMAELYCTVVEVQRHDDFEVPVGAGAVAGLDDAAGSGDRVVITGNTWSANPRPEVVTGIVPEPMP